MKLVYSLTKRAQAHARVACAIAQQFMTVGCALLLFAPIVPAHAQLLWVDGAPLLGPCSSFDVSRREYQQRLLANRHSDNRFFDFQEMVIETIEFERIDVFDESNPDENNALYKLVNSLNMRTREATLRPQLQFSEGDILDPAAVAEAERNLRARSYLSDAYIMPVAVCANKVHLVVVTKDAWTTQPIVSGSREGGETKSRIGLVEGNFLGSGSEISVVLTKDDQRSSVAYRFEKDYILGQPLSLGFGFSDNSDGYARSFRFAKPFYTDATVSSFEFSIDRNRARVTTEQNEVKVASYDVESHEQTVYAAFQQRLDAGSVSRIYAGITQRHEGYENFSGTAALSPGQLDDLSFPWLALEHQSTDYVVMKNINYIESVEDLRIGAYWLASLGYSPKKTNHRAAIVGSGSYKQLFSLPHALFSVASSVDVIRYQENDRVLDDQNTTYYSAKLTADYRWLLDDRQRLVAIGSYRQSRVAGIHDALSLGGAELVRGYPADYVLGNKAYGGSFEYRYHTDWHLLNIVRVGWVGYVDVAVLHNDHFAIENGGYDGELLSNVGVGLRIMSSKTHVSNIVHIDFAAPTGYKKDAGNYQILLRAEQRF